MYCTKCGTQNDDQALKCARCGEALQQIPSSASEPPVKVPNYLAQAIICTLCCCVPFGIVAIVFAAQVNTKLAAGDIEGAMGSSKKAKMWCWIALAVGLVLGIVGLIFQILEARQGKPPIGG